MFADIGKRHLHVRKINPSRSGLTRTCGNFLRSLNLPSSILSTMAGGLERRWAHQRSYSTTSGISTEMGNHLGIQPSHPGHLSLVIPPWVSEMSTQLAMVTYGYRWGRTQRVLLTVGRVTRTVGTLTLLMKGAELAGQPANFFTCMLS